MAAQALCRLPPPGMPSGRLKAVAKRTRAAAQTGGIFDTRRLSLQLEEARELLGVDVKEVAEHLLPNQKVENARSRWYKGVSRAAQKPFSHAEIDRGAAFFRDRFPNKVPSLWPIVDWKQAELFDDFLRLSKKIR